MKRLFVIIILAAIAGIGCKKFLTETPHSSLPVKNFYQSAADAELALTGVYDVLNAPAIQGRGNQPLWGRSMQYLTSMGCDELMGSVTAISQDINFQSMCDYTYTAENTIFWYTYFALYAGINRSNLILEKIPAVDMDATRRTQIVAEATFMRGMFYAYLGWLWGGVPDADSSVVNPMAPRLSLEVIMKKAERDFIYAYNNLPKRNTLVGRVNKYTAAGFLTKLNLYLASSKENSVGSSLNFPLNSFDWVDKDAAYAQALQYAKDVYDNGGYSLIRPYRHLFLAATEEKARNEHMMIVQAGSGGLQEYFLYTYWAGPVGSSGVYSGTSGWVRPVREAYTRFSADDGRRAQSFSGYFNTTANFEIINNYKYFIPQDVLANLSNLCTNKWREEDPIARRSRGLESWGGETDWGILRFADIILMYAELKFKTGDEPGARLLLEEVRKRACDDNMSKVALITAAYKKANFMDELLDERSRELQAEGWRRHDLIRTGRLKAVVQALDVRPMFNKQDVPAVINNYRDYKIWYPIPSREISTNPNLIPNPGYDN